MPDSFVDAREIFEKVKREAEAESGDFLSFAPFTMDSKEGLFVTVEKRRGKEVWDEDVWLSARSSAAFAIRKVTVGHACCNGGMMMVSFISIPSQITISMVTEPRFVPPLPMVALR